MKKKHTKRDISVMMLRQKMAFFVDNMQSYFFLDVLQIQWALLEQKLKDVKEFDKVRKIIGNYLGSIYKQIFLSVPKIVRLIFKAVNSCRKFNVFV